MLLLSFITNLSVIAFLLGAGAAIGAIFYRCGWMWYVSAIIMTLCWVPFVYENGTGSVEKIHAICSENVFLVVCIVIGCVTLTCMCFVMRRQSFDRQSCLSDDERRDYIFKTHEAFSKEVAAARTLITTLASGSFVTLRALSSMRAINEDLSKASLFCLISVFCVLCATFSSIISLQISMNRLSDYDIENNDVRSCSNFFEHVFLFWSAITLLIGYSLFASCYVK